MQKAEKSKQICNSRHKQTLRLNCNFRSRRTQNIKQILGKLFLDFFVLMLWEIIVLYEKVKKWPIGQNGFIFIIFGVTKLFESVIIVGTMPNKNTNSKIEK